MTPLRNVSARFAQMLAFTIPRKYVDIFSANIAQVSKVKTQVMIFFLGARVSVAKDYHPHS